MPIIEKLDGTQINLLDHNIIPYDLDVGPIDIVFDSENVPGRPGRIRTRYDYGNREVSLKLMVFADNPRDTIAKRDLIASLLDGNEPYYIYDFSVNSLYGFEKPGEKTGGFNFRNADIDIDMSKKLLVQRVGNAKLHYTGLVGKRTIEYETFDYPFWYVNGVPDESKL